MNDSQLCLQQMTIGHLYMTAPELSKRARTDDQKLARREAILDTAAALFAEKDLPQLSMDALAAASGLAKGSLYLYFKTKEEVFLALLVRELTAWFAAVGEQVRSAGLLKPKALADVLADSLVERRALTRMLAVLHITLEHNVSRESLLAFKQFLLAGMGRLAEVLETHAFFLRPGQGMLLLLQLDALVIGFQHQANPAPVVLELLELPELAPFRIDFATHLRAALLQMIQGLTTPTQLTTH